MRRVRPRGPRRVDRWCSSQILTTTAKQRPYKAAVSRMHASEPARAGPACQAHQHRLRLIVAGMAERDDIGSRRQTGTLQKLVACRSRGVLDGTPLAARASRHVTPIGDEDEVERRRHAGGEPFVAVSRRAELVVEMCHAGEAHVTGVSQLAQDVDERDRVRSAGQRREHAGVGGNQVMLTDEVTDAIEHDHQGWTARQGGMGGTGQGETVDQRRDDAAVLPLLSILPVPPVLPEKEVPEDGLEPSTPRL